jgi:surface protein
MFYSLESITYLDLTSFDTSSVTNMDEMFAYCHDLVILDISSFNTVNVTTMNIMFYLDYSLTTVYVGHGWNTDAVTESSIMFLNNTNLVGGNGTKYSSTYIDKTYARVDKEGQPGYLTMAETIVDCFVLAEAIKNGDRPSVQNVIFDYNYKSEYNTIIDTQTPEKVATIRGALLMYRVLDSSTNKYDVYLLSNSVIYLNNSQNTNYLFADRTSLKTVTFNNFNTSYMTNMSYMCYNCKSLLEIDLCGLDTSNVTTLENMFWGCENLES